MRAVQKAVETDGEQLMKFKFLIRRVARSRGRMAVLAGVAAMGVGALSAPAALASGVTSLSSGAGIALSPNPITSTGTVSLALPLSLTSSTAGDIFSLTNTSTALGSGAILGVGHSRGVVGFAAAGSGVLGQGTSNAIGVQGQGGGVSEGVLGVGGSSNGAGGEFIGGPASGAGLVADGGSGSGGSGGGDAIDAIAGPGALAGRFAGNVSVSGTLSASHLAAPLSWTTLSLLNSWSGGPFGTGKPAVALDGQGIVHFRGAMQDSGSSFNATAFVLPAQFRPANTVFIPVDTVDATTGRLEIETNGTVLVQDTASGGANAKTFTSLDGATYSLG